MARFVMLVSMLIWLEPVGAESTVTFPDDPAVVNAKRDFGAKGDGQTDDTDALQQALDASCGRDAKHRGKTNVLFIPNGTYRVTRTLVVKSSLGPWLYGESRDGVVIRLDSGVSTTGENAVTCVLRTHPAEKGPTSADWFMRNLRHFTIDVGNNPEVDGIRYYATNTGCLQDVRVIGNGKIGVNAGFLDQSGPNLIQDVEIDGFETGILSQWIWSQTFSRIKITNCRKVGVEVSANVVAIEDLTVDRTPLAIENKIPNDWAHWGGMIALVGGRFTGGKPDGPAILNQSGLYAREVQVEGFAQALVSHTPNGNIAQNRIDEYTSAPAQRLFEESQNGSLRLPVKSEPTLAWERDPSKWLCADEFGATTGDDTDDTEAIQKAFTEAERLGKTVVYFRGTGGPEPNWLLLRKPVRVPKSVRLVIGLGWARLMGEGGFVVDDESASVVKFQNLDAFGGPPIRVTNSSKHNTLVVESCGVHVVGQGQGDIFITDVAGHIDLQTPGQNCWCRQLNPEGDSDKGLVQNHGANLWCLGVKHEGRGVRFATRGGGRTEILGLFYYGGYENPNDARPLFDIHDSAFAVAALREIAFDQHTARVKVRERRGGVERILTKDAPNADGWIGWPLYLGVPKK